MNNRRSKQANKPPAEASQCVQDCREVFDQQRNDRANNCTEERIEKLESAIRLLTSFLIGHLIGELISAVFFR